MSNGFWTPSTQWITWFISGRRNSLPDGVRGSSESVAGEAMRENTGGSRD